MWFREEGRGGGGRLYHFFVGQYWRNIRIRAFELSCVHTVLVRFELKLYFWLNCISFIR